MSNKKQNFVEYDFIKIEKKWQSRWEKEKAFEVSEKSNKEKYYVLEMYPYPSGSGLHMGHAFNYTIGDILARYMRMKGKNVLHPMGYDSFGLPAENAAIKVKTHPKKYTNIAIKNFIFQQKSLGISYDWKRILWSHNPEYYKWNQYFFLKFFEKGLAYRKKAPVNFCSECNTVLANEQVINGKCWRHQNTDVQIKQLEQWFLKTTKYADELLEDIKKIDWPKRIKIMQENWIGKSYGTEIIFNINGGPWKVFTTRPDTIYGVTFLVISAQHPRLMELVEKSKKTEVNRFLKKIKSTSEKDLDKLNKEGVFTGSYGIHPLTNEKIPIYAGNFVIADYGSGMVMAVPAHDQRDFEFAKKYKIPIKIVIQNKDKNLNDKNLKEAYSNFGTLINSGPFNGLYSSEAKEHITNTLETKKLGKKTIQYKLRDWLISRQRYWGTPIPIIYCDKCGIVPVPYESLPVKLPERVKFGKGNPQTTNKSFLEAKCPKCSGKSTRETDTMDTFMDSSWYYLRYCDNKNKKEPFSKIKINYWMPVDVYIGGAEHATLHLIYARFFTKAIRDLGYINFDEPFLKLINQGMVHGFDGSVMAKSRGNIVDPIKIINEVGADSLRLYLISNSSPENDFTWNENGVKGSFKFIKQINEYFNQVKIVKKSDKNLENKLNKTIDLVTKDIENFNYNLAIIKIKQLFHAFKKENTKEILEKFLKILNPFCPHITEELNEKLGNKKPIYLSDWPISEKIDESLLKAEKELEKTIEDITHIINLIKVRENKEPSKIYIYVIPNEVKNYNEEQIKNRFNKEVKIYSVNDKNKYDPLNKSTKAMPGKPAIYLE
ncbi:MAG: leucine--tRNA ligase [Candidatus Pacearchaeota archaeon]